MRHAIAVALLAAFCLAAPAADADKPYNTAKGQLTGITNDVSVNRNAIAGGWFITPALLVKGEYVNQSYNDFPTTDIRNGGNFKGFMMSGVVAF